MDVQHEVVTILEVVLNLHGRAATLKADSVLLGSIPELDSMAVVGVISGLEDRFGFAIDDDEIDGSTFATLGSLVAFVESKLQG